MKLDGVDIAALRVLYHPDPLLRRRAAPVANFDPALARLAARMIELMNEHRGVGLAAPQVGLPLRLFVTNATGEPDDTFVVINPELLDLVGQAEAEEGCLSIPGVYVQVRRAESVRLRAFDLHGKPFEMQAEGLVARIWQHETDHLNGRLILDYMSPAAKLTNRRALRELDEAWAARQPRPRRPAKPTRRR